MKFECTLSITGILPSLAVEKGYTIYWGLRTRIEGTSSDREAENEDQSFFFADLDLGWNKSLFGMVRAAFTFHDVSEILVEPFK